MIFGFAGAQGIVRAVGWIFLVVGLGMSIPFGWGWPVDVAIALSPAQTTGTVLSADWNPSATINGRHPSTVRYEYAVAGVSRQAEYDALIAPPREGDAVVVEYASALPGWSRIGGTRRAWTPWFVLLFVMIFPVVGAASLVHVTAANRREIRAFTHGRPVLARVTSYGEDRATEFNGRHPLMIRWEFRVPSGEVFEGHLTSMSALELEPFGKSREVVVLYDPEAPRRNTLYVP
jgi:hypothetical protein